MFKRILNFCKISVASAPGFFIINISALLIMALAGLGISYSFKLATDTILYYQKAGVYSIKVMMPILFFFLMICIGGNTGNFENMMITAYTRKSKKLFSKFFLYKSYNSKQDDFYNNSFYDNYEFVRKNMDNTTEITVTVFNKLAISSFKLILSALAISYFDTIILVCIFFLSLALIFINKYIVKRRMALNEAYINAERQGNYYRDLLSSRKHAKELRIFKLQNKFLQKWDKWYKEYTTSKYKFEVKATILSNISTIIQQFMTFGLTIYFLYLVYTGKLAVGEFVFLNSIMWSLTYSVGNIVNILSKDLAENYQYVERYENFTGKTSLSMLKNMSESNSKINNNIEEFKSLTFENVCYKYPHGHKNAVNNLNFTLKKGEVISILGYNGSGKSTFLKLMCGLLEDYTGTIKLNGKDIKNYDKESLYRYFGIGFQDFTRYSISLKENVAVGMIESFNDEKHINKAIEKGNLQEVIKKLPGGADTILGKEYDKAGEDLSGGQWQRVILSRAYMGEPDVLILDEPTAAIDPIEEMRMLNQFKDIVKDKTALLISHRIGFARMSSRICIMDGGQIIESGTHEELLKLRGKYYELFTSQQELYKEGDVSA
ncbi:ABC transporter ATP-binding protein [Clostridium sp. KNHs214]|uniref:ABC transporter ATP-binding protein n=1 Tax=Clostridium sp. KNHs214 TaxID=1540257 RepID=UPI00068D2D0A|nr:ABC transporter ATP-binding protein [Clostridium sp. KNHs214]